MNIGKKGRGGEKEKVDLRSHLFGGQGEKKS